MKNSKLSKEARIKMAKKMIDDYDVTYNNRNRTKLSYRKPTDEADEGTWDLEICETETDGTIRKQLYDVDYYSKIADALRLSCYVCIFYTNEAGEECTHPVFRMF